MWRCVIVGGSGGVGRMFADRLASAGADVRIVDPAVPAAGEEPAPWTRHLPADATDPSPEVAAELRGAELVLLAVPEPAALAALPALARILRPGTLLADTLSVKGRYAAAVRETPVPGGVVSINPMFAPTLDIRGRPVAAVVLREGPGIEELLSLIAGWGARVVRLDAEEHDRLAAATQALTHAAVLSFGLALVELDVDLRALASIAPPPHVLLLALLARIVSGAPELYWDVQAGNPWAPQARAALARGLARLTGSVVRGDQADFAAGLRAVCGSFGEPLSHYAGICAGVFAQLPTTAEGWHP